VTPKASPSEAPKVPSQNTPNDYGVWGNVMSSPRGEGVRGRAPAENGFSAFQVSQKASR